ncbi:MAG: hypothetical protein QM485_00975 [Flavobacteriaceae bacterium]
MHKFVKIGLIVISVISFVFLFLMPEDDAPMEVAMNSNGISGMFFIAYFLLAVAVASALIFGVKNMGSSPGALKKAGLAILALVIALGIAYGLSSGTDISIEDMAKKNIDITEDGIKAVGAGINMFGILLLVAVSLIAFGGIKKATSK